MRYIVLSQWIATLQASYQSFSASPEEELATYYTYKNKSLIGGAWLFTKTSLDYLDCIRQCENNDQCQCINIEEIDEGYSCKYFYTTNGNLETSNGLHVTKNKVNLPTQFIIIILVMA